MQQEEFEISVMIIFIKPIDEELYLTNWISFSGSKADINHKFSAFSL
jgi:hypothetical protein